MSVIIFYQMSIADRPVLYSGQLVSICAATCRPLVVALMEDTLLMLCVNCEGDMTLAGEPLRLKDIVRMQFDCDHRKCSIPSCPVS